MSINKSLWLADIPYRKYAYGGLYIGKILTLLAILLLPSYAEVSAIGIAMMLMSILYLSLRLFRAGFREQSILLGLILIFLTVLAIMSMLFFRIGLYN